MSVLKPVLLSAALVIATFASRGAQAQQVGGESAQSRAYALAASFDKSKHLSKEKRGVRKEKYLDVRNMPAIRTNPASYSGRYEVEDIGLILELRVGADGRVTGGGSEPIDENATVLRTFTLVDARIDGALLTGTQVFSDGRREKLEGVFVNRSTFQSPTDPGTTVFGLAVSGKTVRIFGGNHLTRFFYQPRA